MTQAEVRELLVLLRDEANLWDDPSDAPPLRSPDPGDDYLIALAVSSQAVIVTGDGHLLGIAEDAPVFSPPAFLSVLDAL